MSQVDVVLGGVSYVLTIGPDEPLARAVQIMAEANVGAVTVIDDAGQLMGILSERDILKHVAGDPGTLSSIPVAQVMTKKVFSCPRDARLADVNRLMVEHRIRHLPVVDGARPVAMISSRDVLAHQLALMAGMKEAAEQIARLLKCLKTLEVDEVLSVVAMEVPRLFGAGRFTISFGDGTIAPAVCRRNCLFPIEELVVEDSVRACPTCGPAPEACRRQGCTGQRMLIPLGAGDEGGASALSSNLLCLCGWPDHGNAAADELFQYKALLVQDVLRTTLANALRFSETHRRGAVDALTGVWMRRALQARLQEELDRGRRYGNIFSIAFLDVDHFKSINDQGGHANGDDVLRAVAMAISTSTRATDFVSRYGGDEFVVLLPETDQAGALILIDRVRQAVHDQLVRPDGAPVTLSCGVAQWRDETTSDDLLARADAALFQAKRAGRNTVIVADPQ
ncbi:MAG: diguanylate cyclase [Planctomycetota bacterium]|nr:diguanylate cyclase [Planctomycetota bacterium]